MGMFKRMKDLKEVVETSPDMVRQARQLGAQAQEYAVSADSWQQAMTGCNDRIKANRAVAQRFNALNTGRA